MPIGFYGSGYNPYPDATTFTEQEMAEVHEQLRRAEKYAHPTSATTMAERIMGEVATRYVLPQITRDLLTERQVLLRNVRRAQQLAQDWPVPQGTPPMTENRKTAYKGGTAPAGAYRRRGDRP